MRRALIGAVLVLVPGGAVADVDAGREVYNRYCYFCHGYSGDARTVAASMLEPAPRNFRRADDLTRPAMLDVLRRGRPGSAMKPFAAQLDDAQMHAVVDYIRRTFMLSSEPVAGYHTPVNGWTGDPHASPAAPFVLGEASLTTAWEGLSEPLRRGRRLFLSACVTCHTPVEPGDRPLQWRTVAVSYPPGNYIEHGPQAGDPILEVFEGHEQAPPLGNAAGQAEQRGERLFQDACADCHAEDGSGGNWIGSFLQPPPADLRRPPRTVDAVQLTQIIRDGVAGTSMPAWRGVLDEQAVRDVVAYMRHVFPAYVR